MIYVWQKSLFVSVVNMQDIKFVLLKQDIWLSTHLLKVAILLKAKKIDLFFDFFKVCWNVGFMSQQQPYSGLHPQNDYLPPTSVEMTPGLTPLTVKTI